MSRTVDEVRAERDAAEIAFRLLHSRLEQARAAERAAATARDEVERSLIIAWRRCTSLYDELTELSP